MIENFIKLQFTIMAKCKFLISAEKWRFNWKRHEISVTLIKSFIIQLVHVWISCKGISIFSRTDHYLAHVANDRLKSRDRVKPVWMYQCRNNLPADPGINKDSRKHDTCIVWFTRVKQEKVLYLRMKVDKKKENIFKSWTICNIICNY